MSMIFSGYEDAHLADDIVVQVSELLVATADSSDASIDSSIGEVLKLLRDRMSMDVVFVSEFVDGQRVIKNVQQSAGTNILSPGDFDPLEESWCKHVVDGRLPQFIPDAAQDPTAAELLKDLPFPIGTHISTPVVLPNGQIYGTLCCFSLQPNESATAEDLARLQMTAKLAAQRVRPSKAAA